MKKFLVIFIIQILFPTLSIAESIGPFSPSLRGIHFVSENKQNLPPQFKAYLLNQRAQEQRQGYVDSDGQTIRFLFNLRKTAAYEIAHPSDKKYGDYDTSLKGSYKDIKLSFPFKGLAGVNEKAILGYAAIGSYIKGWDGIRVFFVDDDIGVCSYQSMGMLAVELSKETTEYFINKKPSNKVIEGNLNDGFLYTLNWYDQDRSHILECATKVLKKELLQKLIRLAVKIDLG